MLEQSAPIDTQSRIHALWDALSDFDLSQAEDAVQAFLAALADQTGMWNATWAGAIRLREHAGDPLRGWRVAAMKSLRPVAPQPEDAHFQEILRVWDRREIDPSFLLPLRDVGTFRTYSFRRELPAAWFSPPFYDQHYGSVGIHDAVFVAFPLNGDSESHFGFYACAPIPDETIALLRYALRGIKWFHRHLMLSYGLLMASTPLTQTEQRVLQLLLTEATEQRIADQLGLATSTTHQHVVAIFRKFGVRSRAGLMSLWLNGPSARAARQPPTV